MKLKIFLIFFTAAFAACSSNDLTGSDLAVLATYQSPETVIHTLQEKAQKPGEHFVLARAFEKKKSYKSSLYHYANACFDSYRDSSLRLFPLPLYRHIKGFHFKSPFYDDAVYKIAALFYRYREYPWVLKFITEIPQDNQGLYRETLELKIRTLKRMGKYTEAYKAIENAIEGFPSDSMKSRFLIQKASIDEKRREYKTAAETYFSILKTHPRSWQEGVASKRLFYFLEKNLVVFSPRQKNLIARGLFNNGRYSFAADILLSLKEKGTPFNMPLLVRACARTKKYKKTEQIITHAEKKRGNADTLRSAYAAELWKTRRETRAYRQYKILQNSTQNDIRETALFMAGKYLEERKRKKFIHFFNEMLKENPASPKGGEALWLIGRYYLKEGNDKMAASSFEESLQKDPRGIRSDQCRFWLYKLYNKMNKKTKALSHAMDMAVKNSDSTYTWRLLPALAKKYSLKELLSRYHSAVTSSNQKYAVFYHALATCREKNEKQRQERISNIPGNINKKYRLLHKAVYSEKPLPKQIEEELQLYFSTGCSEGIRRTISLLRARKAPSADIEASLCRIAARFGNHYYAIYNLQELYKTFNLNENYFLQSHRLNSLLLPRPFLECTKRSSKKYSVDKNKIYAVIKAESLFNHDAVSPAGAQGFMQLMPATARGIARQMKIKKFNLLNPCTSITMGAHYISWLDRYFKGNFDFIIGGYNAGPGNINKWKKKISTHDMDFFSEFVPFDETRYYIFRTNKFLQQYTIHYRQIN